MTTGSYIKDERSTVWAYSQGDYVSMEIGRVATKEWTGGDWGTQSSPATTRRPFSLAQEPVDKLNADQFPAKIRGADGRPKRSSYREEHAYTMSATEIDHEFCVALTGTGYATRASSVSMGAKASFDPPVWDGNDQNKLIGRLREKLAGSSFHAGVTLGEGKMALGMLASSSTRVYQALRNLKRGNIPQMYKALTSSARNQRYDKFRRDGYLHYDDFLAREKRLDIRRKRQNEYDSDLSAIWLEAQYGWKPLLQDIHGAAAYVAERLERPDVHVVRVRLRKTKKYEPMSGTPTRTELLNGQSSVSVQVVARISTVNHTALSGITDPVSVAWELVPWSFVVDWFLPIGDYLNAASFGSTVDATYVVSTRIRNQWSGFRIRPGNPNGWGPLLEGGKARERTTSLTRVITQSLDAGRPQVVPLSKAFSWTRAANAVALVTQLRSK